MLFLDVKLHELDCTGDMDQLIVVEVVCFSREEHIAVGAGHAEQNRSGLSGLESIFVHDDLQAALAIAELGGAVARHPDSGLSADRLRDARQRVSAGFACPQDAVVPFAFGSESKFRLTFAGRLYRAFQDVVVLIAAKLELPGLGARRNRRWK